jgi:hypothetical protein
VHDELEAIAQDRAARRSNERLVGLTHDGGRLVRIFVRVVGARSLGHASIADRPEVAVGDRRAVSIRLLELLVARELDAGVDGGVMTEQAGPIAAGLAAAADAADEPHAARRARCLCRVFSRPEVTSAQPRPPSLDAMPNPRRKGGKSATSAPAKPASSGRSGKASAPQAKSAPPADQTASGSSQAGKPTRSSASKASKAWESIKVQSGKPRGPQTDEQKTRRRQAVGLAALTSYEGLCVSLLPQS